MARRGRNVQAGQAASRSSMRASRLANWPDPVLAYLRDAAAASAVWELRHCQNLKEILAALDRESVRPLLFKGTALAYGLYEHAPLRIRGDSDLLVAPGDRAKAVAVFLDHDYAALTPIDRVTVTTQATFERRAGDGTSHHFDLHWMISNSPLLAGLFRYDELMDAAQSLANLHPCARGPGPAHAMLIACMHRSVHAAIPIHVDGRPQRMSERLVWLWDIHLLARELDACGWQQLTAFAAEKGLSGCCYDGLCRARDHFGTEIPDAVIEKLTVGGEKTYRYLQAGGTRRLWMDLMAVDGPAHKVRFVRELVFPTRTYVRQKYSGARWRWLPLLYLRHAIDGIGQRIAGP
jgi:hypothetical protein